MLDFPNELELEPTASGIYNNAAVVTNSEQCASIGCDILKKGGSAVDAAIAALLCESLYSMQNAGPGGGCFMTIYNRKEGSSLCLDARECAPSTAHANMFSCLRESSSQGMMSVGIPGELLGYWEAHKKLGKLPWNVLFEPAISLCRDGIPASKRLAASLSIIAKDIMESPSLRKVLSYGEGYRVTKEGDRIKMPTLARTLETIANSPKGALEFYNGSLTDSFVRDVKKYGGIITAEDMAAYKVRWTPSVTCPLQGGDVVLQTIQAPGSGHVLAYMIRLLDNIIVSQPDTSAAVKYQMLAEAFKYGYAFRTELGDPAYVDMCSAVRRINDSAHLNMIQKRIINLKRTVDNVSCYGAKYALTPDSGTLNICVLASNGDAVAATSSINTLFGGLVASPSTGIILNNQMDDFSSPRIVNSYGLMPSPANAIEGGKRPLSSMCPSVLTNAEGDVMLVIGAAGGTHITTAVAQVVLRHLWFGETLKEAIEAPRIHHQLQPMILKYEKGLSKNIVAALESCGHITKKTSPHSSVTAISRRKDKITASFDFRRGGSTAGY